MSERPDFRAQARSLTTARHGSPKWPAPEQVESALRVAFGQGRTQGRLDEYARVNNEYLAKLYGLAQRWELDVVTFRSLEADATGHNRRKFWRELARVREADARDLRAVLNGWDQARGANPEATRDAGGE